MEPRRQLIGTVLGCFLGAVLGVVIARMTVGPGIVTGEPIVELEAVPAQ